MWFGAEPVLQLLPRDVMREELVEILISGEPHPKSRGMTAQGLIVSLTVSFILVLLQVLLFSLLRKKYREVYEPRSYIVPRHMRVPPVPPGMLSWLQVTLRTPLHSIPHTVGLDAYFFLRYLLFVIVMNGVLGCIMVPVLLPLHFTGGGESRNVLDKLTVSNISLENSQRHIAHLLLCICSVVTLVQAFRMELQTYYRIRANHLLRDYAPESSSTLLIKGLYPEYQTSDAIYRFYGGLNGQVRHIWFNRDFTALHRLVRRQKKLLDMLETQSTWLIEKCQESKEEYDVKEATITGNLWRQYLGDAELEGMHARKGSLLTWLKSELSRVNSQVFLMQSQADLFSQVNSCFIQFDSSLACFMATRVMGVNGKKCSNGPGAQCFDDVYPMDVVWTNLSMRTYLESVLRGLAEVLDYFVIFGWALPVAIVSMITQVEYMAELAPRLQILVRNPRLTKVMTSIISPLVLSWLTSQVPFIFRTLAELKGYPTRTLVEMDVQKYLFLFMFFQLFLIVTLATGLPSLAMRILLNASEGAITLASSLPKATTFFISYLIASSMTCSGNTLLQLENIFRHHWARFFNTTPRQKLVDLSAFQPLMWGSLYPTVTNICSISLAYSLVSPIILFAAVLGSSCLFVAFKYRIIFCYVPQCIADGNYYPRAIFQLFSGIYCQELSLLGTLLLAQQPVLAGLSAALIIMTMVAQHRLNKSFQDMNTRIPIDASNPATTTPIVKQTSPDIKFQDLSPSTDQWISLFDDLDTEFHSLSRAQQEEVTKQLFVHPDVRAQRPCVWLPRDEKGIAVDQATEMQTLFTDLRASCSGAELMPDGSIAITQAPPDFDARNLMRI